jgi:hypothetical protein
MSIPAAAAAASSVAFIEPHDNLQAAVVRNSTKRSGEALEPETKRIALIDWSSLLMSISVELESVDDQSNSHAIATSIIISTPPMLGLICYYSLTEINAELTKCFAETPDIDQQKVLMIAKQIYIIGLQNGRFYGITESLEGNIVKYLQDSSKNNLTSLIHQAEKALAQPNKNTIHSIEKQKSDLQTISAQIDQVLGLFCYISNEYEEPIRLLTERADYENCRMHFRRLVQNLQITQNEKVQLQKCAREIQVKIGQLTVDLKVLHTQDKADEVTKAQEILFQGYYMNFWNMGIKILSSAFTETFKEKKLPRPILRAIDRAARIEPRWGGYTHTALSKDPTVIPDPAYLNTMWSKYSEEDIESLMRKFLFSLKPEDLELVRQSIASDEALEVEVHKVLPANSTFMTLKEWCDKHTIVE